MIIDLKGLSIDRLKAFCAVVETGSVIGAADGDPNRQSQISRQIKELEEALEVRLFDRLNRRLVPTPVGRELAMMTTAFFTSMAEITESERAKGEIIRIAAGESVFSGFIVPRFDRMRETLPEFHFVLHQCSTDDAVQLLKSNRADVAVVRSTANLEGLETTPLGTMRYRLAIPRDLLPGRQREGLSRLSGLNVATLTGNGELNRAFTSVLNEVGVEVRIIAESDTFATLREMVLSGSVAAVMPEWTAKSLPSEAVAVIDSPELSALDRKLVIASHERSSALRPLIRAALGTLREIWRP